MPKKESEANELCALFQTKVSDIAFFKQQQWSVTNYAVLSYGTLIFLSELVKSNSYPCERLIGYVLVVSIALGAILAIRSLQKSLSGSRDCVDSVVENLSTVFRQSYNVKWASIEKSTRDLPFPFLFYAYIVVGAVITAWFIYRGS